MMRTISGATRLYVLLGDPLDKARSPEYYNALFDVRGIDAVLVPMEVAPAGFDALVRALKTLRNLDGLIVTMPHKQAVLAHLDRLGEAARRVGAANVVRREADGGWFGDMYDGPGFVGGLRARGIEPAGRRTYMLGCGGVARAIALALAEAGVARLQLHDLDAKRAAALVEALRAQYPRLACAAAGAAEPAEFDLVINATPLGMRPGDAMPFDVSRLTPATAVADVTTKPEITPLLAAARERGCPFATGRDMFEAQTALAERLFGWSA
jgi:shikimate dehydrogenase